MKTLSTHTQISPHTPAAVYRLWEDPDAWTQWDPDVSEVRFAGERAEGAKGWMRPSSGPAATFEIVALRADRLFTTVSRMPGAALSFEHAVEPTPEGSRMTVTIGVDGLLSGLWAAVLRKNFADAASRNIAGLVAYLDAA